MQSRSLDYARFGRQIALDELGAAGQQRLAQTPVTFASARPSIVAHTAATLHRKSGGAVADNASIRVESLPESDQDALTPMALGLAAFAAVEASRRVLSRTPAQWPAALVDALRVPASRLP